MCKIILKSSFSRQFFELKLSKYRILELAQNKGCEIILQILGRILLQRHSD
jgi:hypothetical protein